MPKDVNIQVAMSPLDKVAELTHTEKHYSLALLSVFSLEIMNKLAHGKELSELFDEGLDPSVARSYIFFLQHEYVFSQTNWERAPVAMIPVPDKVNPLQIARIMAEKASKDDLKDFQNPVAFVTPIVSDTEYVTVHTDD